MTATELRARLASVPDVELPLDPEVLVLIDDTVASLASADALASVHADPYWPKWSSPWWEMLALFELGVADRIPKRIARAMVDALNAMPLHTFPIREDEWPQGVDKRRHTSCHCALGCIDQVLAACGVDVDRELPWIAPWYVRYQMADGGYNCDEIAYLVDSEVPSSMVATIAPFEALIRRGPSETCDRAAAMLIERQLRLGSSTVHNAEEREAAKAWSEPCLPRFYFYDVLRGATALVHWAIAHGRRIPLAAIAPAVDHLVARAGDGIVRIGRVAWAGKHTYLPEDSWTARHPAKPTPLVEAVGHVGDASPTLTRHWSRLRRELRALIEADRVV